jgi:hypothetical protein
MFPILYSFNIFETTLNIMISIMLLESFIIMFIFIIIRHYLNNNTRGLLESLNIFQQRLIETEDVENISSYRLFHDNNLIEESVPFS